MIKQWQKSSDLSLKSFFWMSKQSFVIHSFLVSCNWLYLPCGNPRNLCTNMRIRDPQGKDWLIISLLRWGDLQQHTKQNAISSPTDSNQRYIAISFLQISEDTFNKKKWSYFKGFPKSSCCLSELCLRCVEYVIKCRLFTGTETWQCEVLKPTPTHQQNWIISW